MIKNTTFRSGCNTALTAAIALFTIGASAHDLGSEAGTPVCLEANFMLADAMNSPFNGLPTSGPGRVMEMNIFTGERGITVDNPFSAVNAGTGICPDGVVCPGPWKPTGVLSGGMDGHALLTSAGQHALSEFHRDGTPIRTVSYNAIIGTEEGAFGTVPRPLGTQYMPNGNVLQAICDANFFNASNSDAIEPGEDDPAGDGNASNLYFPPVYSTDERAGNSRLLVLDQETLEVIDEYSRPKKWIWKPGEGLVRNPAHDLWGCFAGIAFTSDGMYVSTFHGGAVLEIDWKAGVDRHSRGVGSNKPFNPYYPFKLDRRSNRAKVSRIIDYLGDENGPGEINDANRRDTLRAITFSENGDLFATNRRRSRECLRGEYAGSPGGCNPGVFRQRIDIARAGDDYPSATLALDPGMNIIAGIRINRMSGIACTNLQNRIVGDGGTLTGDECDVETLYVSASAVNPGCVNTGPVGANPCFTPGGRVVEYLIDDANIDGANGSCSGDPADGFGPGEGNEGCALPIAEFTPGNGEKIDPRMLMPIHESFIQ